MIHIVGNEIFRGGSKIGFIRGNDIWSYDGHKLGFFESSHVFNKDGKKIGWLEGEHINTETGKSIRITDNNQDITGGDKPDVCRAAIRLLLGD